MLIINKNYEIQLLIFQKLAKEFLALDESSQTIGKRLSSINVENNEENRKKYRGIIFQIEGLAEYICGAITFKETLL